jgi:uncharacterized protein YacL
MAKVINTQSNEEDTTTKISLIDKWIKLFGYYPLFAFFVSLIMLPIILFLLISIVPFSWIRILLYVLFGAFFAIIVYGLYHTFKKRNKTNNMRSDWANRRNKIITLLKRIFGILVGLIVCTIGMIILGNEKSLIGWILMWYLPLSIGGIVAGYFAHNKAWISGLIIAIIWTGSSVFTDISSEAPAIHIFYI